VDVWFDFSPVIALPGITGFFFAVTTPRARPFG